MKNSKLLLGLVSVAVLVIVGVSIKNKNNLSKTSKHTNSTKQIATLDKNTNNSKNANSKLDENKPQKCYIKDVSDDGRVYESTIYTDGKGRIYTISKTDTSSGEKTTYSIVSNDYVYTWSDNKNEPGMKIPIEDDESKDSYQDEDNSYGEMKNAEGDVVKCEPWKVDKSVFTPPSDVKFMDLSDMQNFTQDFENMQNFEDMQNP